MVTSAITQTYCFPTLTRAANLSPPCLTFPQQTPCLKRNDVLVPVIIPGPPPPPALHLQWKTGPVFSLFLLTLLCIWHRDLGCISQENWAPGWACWSSGLRAERAGCRQKLLPSTGDFSHPFLLGKIRFPDISGETLLVEFSQLVRVPLKVHTWTDGLFSPSELNL